MSYIQMPFKCPTSQYSDPHCNGYALCPNTGKVKSGNKKFFGNKIFPVFGCLVLINVTSFSSIHTVVTVSIGLKHMFRMGTSILKY